MNNLLRVRPVDRLPFWQLEGGGATGAVRKARFDRRASERSAARRASDRDLGLYGGSVRARLRGVGARRRAGRDAGSKRTARGGEAGDAGSGARAAGRVLCPACGGEASAEGERCPRARPRSAWRAVRARAVPGQRRAGRTYAGRDLRTGAVVAVKELSLACAREWKTVELFRRSAACWRASTTPACRS